MPGSGTGEAGYPAGRAARPMPGGLGSPSRADPPGRPFERGGLRAIP